MVYVGAMAMQRESAHQVVSRCRKAGVKTVAGGPLFTLEHQSFKDVDHFVLNEAEVTLPFFLGDLAHGCPGSIYTSSDIAEIRLTPLPAWDLVNIHDYEVMTVQFSRGCPHNCDFCNVPVMFGHKARTKSASQIIAELDALYDLGWRKTVVLAEDNFIGNKRELKSRVLPALIEWRKDKRGIVFRTEASVEMADDEELLQLMYNAGFDAVFIGIETPNEIGLSECGKSQNQHRDLLSDIRRIQRRGIEVSGGFIVGLDSDTDAVFQQQVDFIQQSGIVTAMVNLLQAPTGTPLYERLVRENRVRGRPSGDSTDGTTNIVPRMDMEDLRSGYRSILEQIYAPKQYYSRVKTFLRIFEPPKAFLPLERAHVAALFRTFYYLGLTGIERAHFWQLILWTLFHRPRLFPKAVTLAITGYHCRRTFGIDP